MPDFDNLIPLGPDELVNWGEGDTIFADTYYALAFVNPQSGETEYYPYFTLEMAEDGAVILEENERDFYLMPYKDSSYGFDQLYFSMQMDEKLIWLY